MRIDPTMPMVPADEHARLETLRAYGILDTAREERFDRITRIVSRIFNVPIAMISLIDETRQWFKSACGLTARELPRASAFCAHAILSDDVLVVGDSLQDPRFAANPLVHGDPHIRFYAGAPLRARDQRIGTLAIIDHAPRALSLEETELLASFAAIVVDELDLRVGKRATETRLEFAEASFRELVEKSPEGVLVHRENRILYVNPALCATLGARAADLIGRSPLDLVDPDDRPEIAERIDSLRANGGATRRNEVRYLRSDGSRAIVESLGVVVTFEGRPSVAVLVCDVSERRQMEKQLLIAERMATLGRLAAGVGHEIANPLAYVMVNLDVLERTLTSDRAGALVADVCLAIGEMREGCTRMRGIVADLKTLARDEEQRRHVDVELVLMISARMASFELRDRAQLVTELGHVPHVLGNEGRLGQVFLNLIINAAQAIAPGDASHNEVRLVTRVEGSDVVVEVHDTGRGIDPHAQAHLFEPFFTTKPPGQGTGLGLSICRSIVAAHGGDLTFETQQGKGTVFRVRLPIARVDGTRDEASR